MTHFHMSTGLAPQESFTRFCCLRAIQVFFRYFLFILSANENGFTLFVCLSSYKITQTVVDCGFSQNPMDR